MQSKKSYSFSLDNDYYDKFVNIGKDMGFIGVSKQSGKLLGYSQTLVELINLYSYLEDFLKDKEIDDTYNLFGYFSPAQRMCYMVSMLYDNELKKIGNTKVTLEDAISITKTDDVVEEENNYAVKVNE